MRFWCTVKTGIEALGSKKSVCIFGVLILGGLYFEVLLG